jgi:5-methylcytosine-specific restriction endonuclease McrA
MRGKRKPMTVEQRRRILERDDYQCQVCGSYTLDYPHHIKFRSQGGTEEDENLVTLCHRCHEGFHGGCRFKGRVVDGKFEYNEI